jgi:hypothetical protein
MVSALSSQVVQRSAVQCSAVLMTFYRKQKLLTQRDGIGNENNSMLTVAATVDNTRRALCPLPFAIALLSCSTLAR